MWHCDHHWHILFGLPGRLLRRHIDDMHISEGFFTNCEIQPVVSNRVIGVWKLFRGHEVCLTFQKELKSSFAESLKIASIYALHPTICRFKGVCGIFLSRFSRFVQEGRLTVNKYAGETSSGRGVLFTSVRNRLLQLNLEQEGRYVMLSPGKRSLTETPSTIE